MRVWRYSRWDGSQQEFTLDAKQALDAMSDLMMEGFSAQEALEWMRRYGFELGGLNMRVMGRQGVLGGFQSRLIWCIRPSPTVRKRIAIIRGIFVGVGSGIFASRSSDR